MKMSVILARLREAIAELKEEYTELSKEFDPMNDRHPDTVRYIEFWCSMNRLMAKYALYEHEEN